MTIESLPGSVTAPDPLEVENDALRAEVERLRETVDRLARAPDGGPSRELVVVSLGAALDRVREVEAQVAILTAERDAARAEIRDATEALDEWRPGSRESLAAAVTRLRQALQAADIDLEELFAARKAMSPGGMQRRELPALVTALRAERESILAVVRDYASLMLSHDAVALVDRLRAVLKAGSAQDPQTKRSDGLARAAEAEREACAWLVEHLARTREATGPLALSEVAAAIRARGGKP